MGERPKLSSCPKARFQAVAFDLDGTLIDTESATCEWIAQLLRPLDLEWTPELHAKVSGKGRFFPDFCLELLGVSASRRQELIAQERVPKRVHSPEYAAYLASKMQIKPGAVALLRRLQALQIPLALCTSRAADSLAALEEARPDLRALLAPMAVRVVGGVDPRSGHRLPGKPDPAVYSLCAELLGFLPEHCLAFEDAPTGMESAKAAGFFTVAVPESWLFQAQTPLEPEFESPFAKADRVLSSLEDLLRPSVEAEVLGLPAPAPLLLAVGNATVDVTSKVTRQELSSCGLAPGTEATDFSDAAKAAVVAFARRREDAVCTPGGAALNAIRVTAWAAGPSLRCAFLGSVGRDAHAEVLREAMAEVDVVPLLKEATDLQTGVCASLVEEETKDRALATDRGASAALDVPFLTKPSVTAAIDSASLLYFVTFVLTSQPRLGVAEELAARVCQRGSALAVNLGSTAVLHKVRDPLMRLLPRCKLVFGNQQELRGLGHLLEWPEERFEEDGSKTEAEDTPSDCSAGDCSWVQRLAALVAPGGIAVITAGANPTVAAEQGGRFQSFPVPEVPHAEVVDTCGAGDAFVGGFLAMFCSTERAFSLAACVATGHQCAAVVLRRRGCDLHAV